MVVAAAAWPLHGGACELPKVARGRYGEMLFAILSASQSGSSLATKNDTEMVSGSRITLAANQVQAAIFVTRGQLDMCTRLRKEVL